MALAMLISFLLIAISSADLLKNPDFESPPTNITANNTAPVLLLTKANTIPGWSFNGTVRYVTSGPNISLPGNGHGLQLGQGGKINQTFRANNYYTSYVLTFSLAPGSKDCSNKSIAVNVSSSGRSKVFSLQRRYGKETWESHAYVLDSWGDEGKPINLEIRSASVDADPNDTCGPIVDTFMTKRIENPIIYGDNLQLNGGFEVGPAFLTNSNEGILLNDEPGYTDSLLQQWSVIGTVKYINSKHYSVPKGKAAIELVSGAPSGIQTDQIFEMGSKYRLEFMMGDANDSCLGDFIVYAQVGNAIQNFTMRSNGTGSAQNCSMTFKAKHTLTSISFVTFKQSQTNDHVLCGPVIDNVAVQMTKHNIWRNHVTSYGLGQNLQNALMFPCLFFIVTILHLVG